MKNIRQGLAAVCLAGWMGTGWAACPDVSVLHVAQSEASGVVTVTYTLSGAAIVTADVFLPDGTSVGTNALAFCDGDIMRKMASAGTYAFTWQPGRACPAFGQEMTNLTFAVTAWDPATPPDVIVSDLRTGTCSYYPGLEALPGGVTDIRYKTHALVLRRIYGTAAGVWTMGSDHEGHTATTAGNFAIEKPHAVCFTNDWYLGVYPVTQAQYYRVKGTWPDAFFTNVQFRATRPVERVTYQDVRGLNWPVDLHDGAGGLIVSFRNKIGLPVDLPTEAQWEFSCRAGTTTLYYTGTSLTQGRHSGSGGLPSAAYADNLDAYDTSDSAKDSKGYLRWRMWTDGNGTPCVGSYEPNAFGLYDMHGGVYEFCLDWANTNQWDTTIVYTNPVGCVKADSFYRGTSIARGGTWRDNAAACRSSARRLQGVAATPGGSSDGTFGFRLALPNVPPVPVTVTGAKTLANVVFPVRTSASGLLQGLEARVRDVSEGIGTDVKTHPAGTIFIFR